MPAGDFPDRNLEAGELLARLEMSEPVPDLPIHPRVLTRAVAGGFEQVFVAWRDPGGARALHLGLRSMIEAALLAELCRVGDDRAKQPLARIRLFLFAPVADADAAVAAFALRRVPLDAEARAALAHVRGEASSLGRPIPDDPAALYLAPAVGSDLGGLYEPALAERMGDEPFGRRPGALFAALRAIRAEHDRDDDAPRTELLERLERELVADREEVLRWIPPACFLALCDAVGVVAARAGREVAWAEGEPDAHGVTPPPLLRIAAGEGFAHVPVGVELLRWCVMPRRSGEVVPSLADWLRDRIGV